MKRMILLWLLGCLLLLGCTVEAGETQSPATEQTVAPTQPIPGEQLPASEVASEGNVRSYDLEGENCLGIRAMGDGVVLLSQGEKGSILTLLTGEPLTVAASVQLETVLDPNDPSLQTGPEGVSYYDAGQGKLVLLDESLREIQRIPVSGELSGAPLLSADRKTLYYSTGDSLWAMETENRISRILRQEEGGTLVLQQLLLDGSVLQCSIPGDTELTRFYSGENGQLLEEWEGSGAFASDGRRYIAQLWQYGATVCVFGEGDRIQMLSDVHHRNQYVLLPESYGVLKVVNSREETVLSFCNLEAGAVTAKLTLPHWESLPLIADSGTGVLWLLSPDGSTLYRWDTAADAGEVLAVDAYYSRSNPDLSGIARCQELARQIGERHGVEVLVWEDVYARQPWDYRVTEEYLVPVLEARLKQLDAQLSHFPEGFLTQLQEHGSGLTICLVRRLEGNTASGTVEAASGVQYWLEDRSCIALSTVDAWEGSFYHELCHVLDTRIYARSNAYDQWDKLNPSGFAYDYDYAANAVRNAGEYLRDAQRYFIDTYSMSFPKEDRARVLEYAMTEGNEHYFQSKPMQAKLKQVCIGIREAFGLKKSPETFLWEQYLQESLAYTK